MTSRIKNPTFLNLQLWLGSEPCENGGNHYCDLRTSLCPTYIPRLFIDCVCFSIRLSACENYRHFATWLQYFSQSALGAFFRGVIILRKIPFISRCYAWSWRGRIKLSFDIYLSNMCGLWAAWQTHVQNLLTKPRNWPPRNSEFLTISFFRRLVRSASIRRHCDFSVTCILNPILGNTRQDDGPSATSATGSLRPRRRVAVHWYTVTCLCSPWKKGIDPFYMYGCGGTKCLSCTDCLCCTNCQTSLS